jgi:hypothetical protein
VPHVNEVMVEAASRCHFLHVQSGAFFVSFSRYLVGDL